MAELKIKADSGGGTVSFKGPATTTSNAAVQLTLPVDDGTADQYLKTDGSGALSWATVSSVGGATALSLNDGVKVNFGADNDLRIEGGSGNSVIQHQDTAAGDLFIDAQNSNVYIRSGDGGTNEENAIVCENNSKVKLYHSGTHVAETSANGLAFPDGKGIDFAAAGGGAAGSTGSLLTDYEEGTYTPNFTSSSGSFTHGTTQGRYVKIGQLVYCTFRVDWTGGSPTGAMFISAPFTTTNSNAFGLTGAGGVSYNGSFDDAYSLTIGVQGNNSASAGKFYARSTDDSTTDPNPAGTGRCDGWMMFYT